MSQAPASQSTQFSQQMDDDINLEDLSLSQLDSDAN